MIITISGLPGSGKSTVAKIVARKLNLKRYYMGKVLRQLAAAEGITINELLKKGELNPQYDKKVDDFLISAGKHEDDFIVEARTGAHFIPHSLKVFIAVDPKIGAERILGHIDEQGMAKRNELPASSVDEQMINIEKRIACDRKRYQKYYDIDFLDKDMYDLWIDSGNLTADQVAHKIIAAASSISNH